jgi:hypothetical protein
VIRYGSQRGIANLRFVETAPGRGCDIGIGTQAELPLLQRGGGGAKGVRDAGHLASSGGVPLAVGGVGPFQGWLIIAGLKRLSHGHELARRFSNRTDCHVGDGEEGQQRQQGDPKKPFTHSRPRLRHIGESVVLFEYLRLQEAVGGP